MNKKDKRAGKRGSKRRRNRDSSSDEEDDDGACSLNGDLGKNSAKSDERRTERKIDERKIDENKLGTGGFAIYICHFFLRSILLFKLCRYNFLTYCLPLLSSFRLHHFSAPSILNSS